MMTINQKEKAAVGDPVKGANDDDEDSAELEMEMQDSVNLDLEGSKVIQQTNNNAGEKAADEMEEEEEDYSLKYPKEYHNKSLAN